VRTALGLIQGARSKRVWSLCIIRASYLQYGRISDVKNFLMACGFCGYSEVGANTR